MRRKDAPSSSLNMSNVYSSTTIRRKLEDEIPLYLVCRECGGASFDTAEAHFNPSDSLLSTLCVTEKRGLPNTREPEDLRDSLADALVNRGNKGQLHFECHQCGKMNMVDGVTIGPLDAGDCERVIYATGEHPYPGEVKIPLREGEPMFVCPDCSHEADPEAARKTGPAAPEFGWEYYECPWCKKKASSIGEEVY